MYGGSVLGVIVGFSIILVKCDDLVLDDYIIVNEINEFRNKEVCSNAYQNMNLISSSRSLVELANDIINNESVERNTSSYLYITAQTCKFRMKPNVLFKKNVLLFIRSCISGLKLPGNSKLLWLKNPLYTEIGCAYSLAGANFILCILHNKRSELTPFNRPIHVIDRSKNETELLKQNGALFLNQCPRLYRSIYKSCYLLTSTRDYITNKINSFRKSLYPSNERVLEVKWDFELEMSAIELSQFKPEAWANNCFTIASHRDGFVVREFIPNKYFLVQPYLDDDTIQFIATSDSATGDLYGIGCAYFLYYDKGVLLCVWNEDKSTTTMVLRWLQKNIQPFNINPYLIYTAMCIIVLNIVIIVLFLKAARLFQRQKALRRKNVESIYSKPE